jgi:hypothetical protein
MRRSIVIVLLGILGIALLCLGASETLTNHTGKTASGVTIRFSQSVRISNYDESVFPDQDPSGRSDEFTFSGGKLANGGRFSVTWTPSSARITDTEWIPLALPEQVGTAVSQSSEAEVPPADAYIPEEYALDNLQFVNVFWWWDWFSDGLTEDYIASRFQEVEADGFGGISLDYWMFIDSLTSPDIHKCYVETGEYLSLRTPQLSELERVLRIIRENTDLAIEIHVSLFHRSDNDQNDRMSLAPSDPSRLFDDLFDELRPVVELCDKYSVEIFTPMVELDSLEKYTSEIHRLLDRLDPLFDGWFAIDQSTNNWIRWGTWSERRAGAFWGWCDSDGKPLIISLSGSENHLADSSTASQESMRSAMVVLWKDVVQYYRDQFPGHYVWFGELAVSRNQGTAMGQIPNLATAPLAIDEMKRVLYAVLMGARDLRVDGFCICYYTFYPSYFVGDNTWHFIVPDDVKPYLTSLLQ